MSKVIVLCVVFATSVHAWYNCDQRPFCVGIRNTLGREKFGLVEGSLVENEFGLEAELINNETSLVYTFKLTSLAGGTFRIQIDDPAKPRHTVPEALKAEPETSRVSLKRTANRAIVENEISKAEITWTPFVITVSTDQVSVVVNGGQRMEFKSEEDDEAIAMDFSFPGAQRAYGIPERAERLSLQNSSIGSGRQPYRMFNVDHCCYDVGTTDPLYGAVPVLYAHSTERTAGIFWLTSAETFVDLNNEDGSLEALFISASGAVDLFVFIGPTLPDTVKQYTALTGTHPLPQLFALGYHQSRYSYGTQDDLLNVMTELDNHDFPLDVMWLDIDYTDGKKYFTWNYTAFPDPFGMQVKLASLGRHLVTIIDPHIKVEQGYFVYDEMIAQSYEVKNEDGTSYEGKCWPGLSSYVDFTNPEARDWYGTLYGYDKYPNTTSIVNIWNDMNEPAVFESIESTMSGSLVHHDGWLHRDVHNMYGFMHTMATYNGLKLRNQDSARPFLLTRSHFAGSQRYAAMWTGDNLATWNHLRYSIPMCLTEGLVGMTFCGADVGGFINNTSDELLQRWYQLGAWYPFMREHTDVDAERREPYLFPEDMQTRFRTAMKGRYAHLPYWYTLFFEHENTGEPVMRPLTYHYSNDAAVLDIDDQFMIGRNILVSPVVLQGATALNTYFPGGASEIWYDIQNDLIYYGTGAASFDVTLDSAPVFYRGGSIIPRKDISRRSTIYMTNDPINLYVFLDSNNAAIGNLYVDDYESFKYREKNYHYIEYKYEADTLTSRKIHEDAAYDQEIILDQTIIHSASGARLYTTAEITQEGSETRSVKLVYSETNSHFTLGNLNIKMHLPFEIKFV